MLNPYSLIITIFIAAGLGATLWGWMIIRKARIRLSWPKVPGTIVESLPYSKQDAHLPHITYQYSINGKTILSTLTLPAGVTPSEELAKSYANKYPAGSSVQVYYDPKDPHLTTLEPGLASGDWLVFALGIGGSLFGIGMLLFGGF